MTENKLTILLVEDNPDDADLIEELLAEAAADQFKVEVVERLSQSLERLLDGGIDAILLDLSLPDSQGMGTVNCVLDAAPDLPVVVLTGLDDDQLGIEAVERGAQDYLVKGEVDGRLLARALRYALERKRAAEALRVSEEKYRLLFDSADVFITVFDRQGVCQLMNERVADMFMGTPSDFVGKSLGELHPEVAEEFTRRIKLAIDSGQSQEYEDEVVFPRGIRWLLSHVHPVPNRQGVFQAVQIISQDLTGRKQAEEAVREQRALAEALTNVAAKLNSTLDLEEVLDSILANVGTIASYDSANIMLIESGKATIVRSRGYADSEQVEQVHFAIAETPSLYQQVETRKPVAIPDTHGSPIWMPVMHRVCSYAGAPIVVDGEVIGFINLDGAMPNTFTAKHAQRLQAFADQAAVAIKNARLYHELTVYSGVLEQAVEERTSELRQTKERVEAILNHSPDPILLLKPNGAIESANPAQLQSSNRHIKTKWLN